LAGADLVWANDVDLNSIPAFDILTAGFPCQSFSVLGNQKGFADPRGTMYYEILRVIDMIKPSIVLLENVKNLVEHDNGRTFITIYSTLAERGYGVKYAILGAHTHGNIPQYRDRIFIAAFLDYDELEKFIFPNDIPLNKKLNDIINRNIKINMSYYYNEVNKYHATLNDRMIDINAIYRIDDSGVAKRAWNICPTLKANMGTYHDRVPLIRDNFGIRKITPAECLALQGFPKEYGFPDIPIQEAYKQLGNTVCVPVVMRIAKKILT